jgi:hypothetical protein
MPGLASDPQALGVMTMVLSRAGGMMLIPLGCGWPGAPLRACCS